MIPNSLLHELDDFLTLLLESEVAIATTKVVALQGGRPGGFQRITWAANSTAPGNLFRQHSATVAEYRGWIDCNGYSAVLFDGSLIQISYDFEYSELVGHRLLYFPCPFDLDLELLNDGLFLAEVIDLYQGQEITSVRLRSPVRFDYDPNANTDTHPASHMTFQWSHSRIPVTAPVSPGRFIQFIFKNFYPEMWTIHEFIQEWPQHEIESTITPEEQRVLHLSSLVYP